MGAAPYWEAEAERRQRRYDGEGEPPRLRGKSEWQCMRCGTRSFLDRQECRRCERLRGAGDAIVVGRDAPLQAQRPCWKGKILVGLLLFTFVALPSASLIFTCTLPYHRGGFGRRPRT